MGKRVKQEKSLPDQPVDQILRESEVRPLLENRKVDFKISELPEVIGDYNLLRMVWINLLDNAIKYTRPRKKAVIQIDCKKEKKSLFSASAIME